MNFETLQKDMIASMKAKDKARLGIMRKYAPTSCRLMKFLRS